MADDFLDIIRKVKGDGDYAGDQFGGAGGQVGNGLPTGGPGEFMFATGIECSYPTIGNGRIRRDLLEECGHYGRWRDDLRLTRELGLKVLRYGLPYHKTHVGPGRYDFSFADEAMAEIRRLGITPILDLLHFGVPDWLGNFQNPGTARSISPPMRRPSPSAIRGSVLHAGQRDLRHGPRQRSSDGVWNEQLKRRPGLRHGDEAPGGGEHPGHPGHRQAPAGRRSSCRAKARNTSTKPRRRNPSR